MYLVKASLLRKIKCCKHRYPAFRWVNSWNPKTTQTSRLSHSSSHNTWHGPERLKSPFYTEKYRKLNGLFLFLFVFSSTQSLSLPFYLRLLKQCTTLILYTCTDVQTAQHKLIKERDRVSQYTEEYGFGVITHFIEHMGIF